MNRTGYLVKRELSRGKKTFWELVKAIDIPIRSLIEFLNSSSDINYDETYFSYERELKHKENFDEELKRYKEMITSRPKEKLEFFQSPLTPEHVFKRLGFMYQMADIEGKDIFILGDDDYFSVAIALTKLAKRIVVLEVDETLVASIKEISENHNLNIEAYSYNATQKLSGQFHDRFDTFICDPVETEYGISIFLSRGASALKENSAAYFGLTDIECPLIRWKNIEQMLLDMNFAITDIKRNFSSYSSDDPHFKDYKLHKLASFKIPKPENDYYHSNLIRAVAVETPKPLIDGEAEMKPEFYDDEWVMTN